MGVIRVLVEEGEQDPSAQQQFEQSDEQRYQNSQSYAGSPEGESTLHALVRGEHWWQVYEGLPFLLQRGACTELRDAHGKTPLSAALDKCGSLTFDKLAVELLIQYGADVNATDFSGSSSPQRNFDLEVRNASGETPLLTTAQRNSSPDHTQEGNAEGRSATGLLILHGANTRAVDGQGNSMLHLAVKTSYTTQDDLQLILNEAPELMNLPKVEGITPLHCAVQRWWHSGTFKFYWEHGADIHAADGKGNSLLHFLLRGEFQVSKSGEVVRCQLACDLDFLLAQGLDINLLNETGETPIFSFIRYGKVRARNYKDRFPGFIESPIFDHFTKVGVDRKIRNKKGQSYFTLLLLLLLLQQIQSTPHSSKQRLTTDSLNRVVRTLNGQ
ncbi:hypothetical protein N0V91_009536 [Didymella pomorum]|uniref:Uncharacterized protein n=1 Tax=Didymella pomorum TaxID=749634 RepID=A0A9W8Z5C1_9PLEO|nr:hypothetical protein N0V91_009536 [Didymella pomorum]